MPARSYPEWLRQSAMWVPAAAVTTALVTPRLWTTLAAAGRDSLADQLMSQGAPESEMLEQEQSPEGQRTVPRVPRPVLRWGIGLTAGAAVYGYMRVALWADGAMEDKLRECGVSRPRIVLAVLGGLATGATASPRSGREQAQARQDPPLTRQESESF